MSEIPKSCEDCPIVGQCNNIVAALEKKEDKMIMDMMGDGLEQQVESMRTIGMPLLMPTEDGTGMQEVEMTIEMARELAARDLDELRRSINVFHEVLTRATTGCMGTLALHASADGMDYDVTVCRSPENDNQYMLNPDYLVNNEKSSEVDEVKIQVARIHRKSIKSDVDSVPDSAPES